MVEITETAGKFALTFTIRGTDHGPVAIELAFRHGGMPEGVKPVAGIKDAFLLEGASGRRTMGGDAIDFGPRRAEHTYTQVRGAVPKWDGRACI